MPYESCTSSLVLQSAYSSLLDDFNLFSLVQEDSSKPQSAISGESHYFHHSKAVVAVK